MVIFGESNSGGMGARKGGHVLTSSMWGESADDQTTDRDRVGMVQLCTGMEQG